VGGTETGYYNAIVSLKSDLRGKPGVSIHPPPTTITLGGAIAEYYGERHKKERTN
jgi:hypothetical protein